MGNDQITIQDHTTRQVESFMAKKYKVSTEKGTENQRYSTNR